MRRAFIFSLVVLFGCGGGAIGQSYKLSSISTVTGPYNLVYATKGGSTAPLMHVEANQPVAGRARITTKGYIGVVIDETVTISSTAWAPSANNGTYTVKAIDNPSGPFVFQIECAGCVTYDDETGIPPPHENCSQAENPTVICSPSFDAFPNLQTDGNGLVHLFYVHGYGQQSVYPADIYERTTSDGVNWSTPTALFSDSSAACSTFGFAGYNCQFENIAAGVAANGHVIVFGADTTSAAGSLGVFYRVWNGAAWSSARQLAGPAPDASDWYVVYGNIHRYGSQLAVFAVSVNLNMYLVWSCDDGETWKQASCNGGASSLGFSGTPEGDCFSGGGSTVLCIVRTGSKKFQLHKSTDLGATWSDLPMAVGFSQVGTPSELVAPMVYCPARASGSCVLTYGERYGTSPSAVTSLWFRPGDIIADATATGVQRVLSTGTVNPTDCCYSAATALSDGTLLFAWYRYPASNYGWKLYTMTATGQGAGGGLYNAMRVIGAVR